MTRQPEMLDEPHVEWQRGRPFAFARLSTGYASTLEALAHRYAPQVNALASARGEALTKENPTAARYTNYNVFLLDGQYLPLFLAIRSTYRALVRAIEGERSGRFIKCWYNMTAAGVSIGRHRHHAIYIGTFAACAAGSSTRFGLSELTSDEDHVIQNRDGQLLMTIGMNHFHETSSWSNLGFDRVTYAFDVVNAGQWRADRVQVPLDGDFE